MRKTILSPLAKSPVTRVKMNFDFRVSRVSNDRRN